MKQIRKTAGIGVIPAGIDIASHRAQPGDAILVNGFIGDHGGGTPDYWGVTDRVDIANARVGFPGGCVANLTASRVSTTPMRRIRFFQRDGYFSIDFLAEKLGRPHQMRFGAYSLYGKSHPGLAVTAEPAREVAAN